MEVFRFSQRVRALAFRLDSSIGGALAYRREDAGSNPVQVMAKRLHELEFIAIRLNNLNKVVESFPTIAQWIECLTSVDTGVSRLL